MSDPSRETGVIYTGRSASPAAIPSVSPHAVPLPPIVGGGNASPNNFTPIITRSAAASPAMAAGGAASPSSSGMVAPSGIDPQSITIIGLNSNNNASPGVDNGATPIPSILRQPQHAPSVDPSLPRLRALPVKEFLVGKSHFFVIGQCIVASIMYIASWGAAVAYEDGGTLKRRHVASILGFIFQILTTIAVVVILRTEPQLFVLYALQVMALVTLFLTTVGMGMNNVIVDLCTANRHEEGVLCPAHFAEFFAAFFVSIGMMLVFFATQQRIAVLIDKGILSNIRGRMTQL